MGELRENVLLCKALKFVVIPICIFAIFGSFFPFVQAFVPVHEADVCICLFYSKDHNISGGDPNGRHFPIMSNVGVNGSKLALEVINTFVFYTVNWCFLLVNIIAIYKIRKMKDRLDIRKEMTWAVALWSTFDFFQYVFYFFTQLGRCPPDSPTLRYIVKYAPEYSYITIILRDFVVHCVMVYFIVKVNRRELNIKNELAR